GPGNQSPTRGITTFRHRGFSPKPPAPAPVGDGRPLLRRLPPAAIGRNVLSFPHSGTPGSPMHRPAAIALLALLAACGDAGPELATAVRDTLPGGIPRVMSPAPTGWADSADPRAWHLVAGGVFRGEEGPPSELIGPSSLAVDAAGRIYVADRKPVVIKVFDASGRFLHTIGREGEGPGEFRAPFIA